MSGVKDLYGETKKGSKDAAKLSVALQSSILTKLSKSRLSTAGSRLLKFNKKWNHKRRVLSRNVRTDAVSAQTKRLVVNFLCSPSISTERPVRFKGKRLMMISGLQAFKTFKRGHPDTSLSYSTFLKPYPKNLVPYKPYHFNCRCTYCNNVEILLKAINRHMGRFASLTPEEKNKIKMLTVYQL